MNRCEDKMYRCEDENEDENEEENEDENEDEKIICVDEKMRRYMYIYMSMCR